VNFTVQICDQNFCGFFKLIHGNHQKMAMPTLSSGPLRSPDFAPLVVIDYSRLISKGPNATEEAERLFQAATTSGFFYLDLQPRHHSDAGTESSTPGGILLEETKELFPLMKDFFNLDINEKLKYDMTKYGGYFGYVLAVHPSFNQINSRSTLDS
jgi:isopenicillin N synthase-like dioxygenase